MSPDGFAPIQRVRPAPWILRLIQPTAGANKVVCGSEIVGGIRNDRRPSIMTRTRFQCAHQAQLKGIAAVPFQHPDTAEISRVAGMRRRNHSGKSDRYGLMIGEPPLTLIEFRDRCAVKECETVQVYQRVRDFVFMPIDCADPVHRPDFKTSLLPPGTAALHEAASGLVC